MPRFKNKKNPFSLVPQEFQDQVASSGPEELKSLLSQTTKNEEQNLAAQKADPDLKSLKEQVKDATAGYREGTKANRQKVKFIIRAMSDKGDAQAAEIVSLSV